MLIVARYMDKETITQNIMRIENYDFTGKKWTLPLWESMKLEIDNPMLAMMSPYLSHVLHDQGWRTRLGQISTTANEYDTQDKIIDGTLTISLNNGLPDDVVILSNLDTVLVFYGLVTPEFERTGDQMPLWLEQQAAFLNADEQTR